MKFLIEWKIKPKYRREVNKVVEKFEQPKEVKSVFAAHHCVGASRGIAVVEADDAVLIQKTLSQLMDYTNFKVTPILPIFPE